MGEGVVGSLGQTTEDTYGVCLFIFLICPCNWFSLQWLVKLLLCPYRAFSFAPTLVRVIFTPRFSRHSDFCCRVSRDGRVSQCPIFTIITGSRGSIFWALDRAVMSLSLKKWAWICWVMTLPYHSCRVSLKHGPGVIRSCRQAEACGEGKGVFLLCVP